MKFIVIDGKKYKVDPSDPTKALLVDGEMVLYVEEPETPPAPNPTPVQGSHDWKMLNDPEYARLFNETEALKEDKRKRDEREETERTEEMRKRGEFQQIAEDEKKKREAAEGREREAVAVLEKYKGTVNEIRDDMLAQIPEDKRSLIPDGSSRKQIEYIKANAKFLGVSLVSKGSPVPENGDTPPLDEEGKLQKEYNELMAKPAAELTNSDSTRLTELAGKLKEIRSRKVGS